MPNKLWNNLPQAANPLAVYGIKKIMITNADTQVKIFC